VARTRSPAYDDQREMILARAAELFSQRGYPATSMNQLAEACGLSKPTLYHYYRDKYALLVQIAEGHVARLAELVRSIEAQGLPAEQRLHQLVVRFVEEYADAQHAHRVLTEDVRFLEPDDRARVLVIERQVVDGFARALVELRPEFEAAHLARPVSMLLFGMINWMFTWLRPGGRLGHDEMAPIVADLFFGGLHHVRIPPSCLEPDPSPP
jgi:TetR/AcrR family transcriptional regulator